MEKPKITLWDESKVDEQEEFVVFKPVRINTGSNSGAKGYAKGDTVKVSGSVKKDLYFQNKIMYKKDYDKVTAFEKEMKENFNETPESGKQSSEASLKNAAKK